MKRFFAFGERGDTLVEVTIALAILATVLSSSFAVAVKAFQAGQSAKERATAFNLIQEQAEGLRALRDQHGLSWNEFVAAVSPVLSSFHMVVDGGNKWSPQVCGSCTTNFYTVTIKGTRIADDKYQFDITAVWDTIGGGTATTTVTTYLVAPLVLSEDIAGGGPPGPPAPPPGPPPPPCGTQRDIVMSLDISSSMNRRWDTGSRKDKMREVATRFVQNSDLGFGPTQNLIGLVAQYSNAFTLYPITDQVIPLVNAIQNSPSITGTQYDPAMRLAQTMLNAPPTRPTATKVLILISDGQDNDPVADVAQAQALGAAGIVVYTVGITSDTKFVTSLSQMVQNGGTYAYAESESDLDGVIANLSGALGCP